MRIARMRNQAGPKLGLTAGVHPLHPTPLGMAKRHRNRPHFSSYGPRFAKDTAYLTTMPAKKATATKKAAPAKKAAAPAAAAPAKKGAVKKTIAKKSLVKKAAKKATDKKTTTKKAAVNPHYRSIGQLREGSARVSCSISFPLIHHFSFLIPVSSLSYPQAKDKGYSFLSPPQV